MLLVQQEKAWTRLMKNHKISEAQSTFALHHRSGLSSEMFTLLLQVLKLSLFSCVMHDCLTGFGET